MNGIGFAITSILFIAILSASNFCNCMDLERGAKWWEEPSPEFVDFVYENTYVKGTFMFVLYSKLKNICNLSKYHPCFF